VRPPLPHLPPTVRTAFRLTHLLHVDVVVGARRSRAPHAQAVESSLCASQQASRRLLTPTERKSRDKHRAHLAQTRFCPKEPGVPPPYVPWGSVAARTPRTARTKPASPASPAVSPPSAAAAVPPPPPPQQSPHHTPRPGRSNEHVRFFPQTLRPFHGSPMRLLDAMPDGKRRTSDLVKCIRAGQVDSMDLSLAIQIPDGFEAVNATRIQSNFRGRRVRRGYLAQKQATVHIQASMRGKIWRNALEHLNWHAKWIQTVWRKRKEGWRPWMCRSPMRMDQLDAAATVIEAQWRCKTGRRDYLIKKRAAIRIQKHMRGIYDRAAHAAWLMSRNGPAGLAKERERLMAAMAQAGRLLDDDGGTAEPQPAKSLRMYKAVHRQAAGSEVSCGVPQLSKNGVTRDMRNKMPTIESLYATFVSSSIYIHPQCCCCCCCYCYCCSGLSCYSTLLGPPDVTVGLRAYMQMPHAIAHIMLRVLLPPFAVAER
jgi:hypothetical protein